MYALMHGQARLDESALPITASAELRRSLGSAGTPWILLTFLAGAELDPLVFQTRTRRTALYLAALSAVKTKPWRSLYEHYRAKGLSTTAALVILARRIACTAWSIYTYKAEFDPARLTNPVVRTH